MVKPRLMAPGPVEVPPAVLEAIARPPLHHRSEAFAELLLEARLRLAELASVPGEDVVVLTGSGTAGFEAAFLACVPPGAKVIGLHAGRFGRRWVELARGYGHEVVEVEAPWGEPLQPDALREALARHPDAAAITTTHSETSTGALHDVAALAAAAREAAPDALFVVDAVTSLGVAELRPGEWGLDAVVSGSQKGVMLPPGLAFAWLSERAWERDVGGRAHYLDLRREREKQRSGQTGTTPAVSLVAGLIPALDLLLADGLEALWSRRARLNGALLAAGEAAGCGPFARRPSPAVAALRMPDAIAAPDAVAAFARRGVRIAGGQEHTKPVMIRPSLMGWADAYDALAMAALLESILRELGHQVPRGRAAAAALEVLEAA